MMKQKKYYDLEDKEMYDAEAIDVKYAKFFEINIRHYYFGNSIKIAKCV